MTRQLRFPLLRWGIAVGVVAGCSGATPADAPPAATAGPRSEGSEAGGGMPGDDGATSGSGASGGMAGGGVGSASDAGVGGGAEVDASTDATGGTSTGSQGTDGHATASDATLDVSATEDASHSAGPFTCSEMIGLESTMEWYLAGFEQVVVDARWQLRWHHRGYIEDWADPMSPYWGTYCDGQGCSRVSPCTQGADSPDRVVFVALNWIYTTESQWESDLRKDVVDIQTKYPGVRNIELISSSRCPDSCTTIDPPGTMDELTAIQTCRVPTIVDQAIAAVAASNPALVTIGPKFFTNECTTFVSLHGPHLTTAGRQEMAAKVGAYYAAHP